MNAFFAMGGYAAFIWPAYGASAIGLLAMVWQCWASWRSAKKKLEALEQDRS
jgi:heme exporter protein D